MKRDRKLSMEGSATSEALNRPPSSGRSSAAASRKESTWGDSVPHTFHTRLLHGFRADFKHDTALWAAATRVIVHAIRTFGSEEKAHSWLTSKCGALGNEQPYELLKSGKSMDVDEELDRIDYGVYV
jgi:hypothetical protein